jgi:hypothetical protein
MKIEIDTDQIWDIIEQLLSYPYPTLCRHYMIGIVVSRLFENNDLYKDSDDYNEFCRHAVSARDYEALEYMNKIRNYDEQTEKATCPKCGGKVVCTCGTGRCG